MVSMTVRCGRMRMLLLCLASVLGLLAMHSTPALAEGHQGAHGQGGMSASRSAPATWMAPAPSRHLPAAPAHHVLQPCLADIGRTTHSDRPGVVPVPLEAQDAWLAPTGTAVRAVPAPQRPPNLGAPDLNALCISRT